MTAGAAKLPARRGVAVRLPGGGRVQVINTYGQQVVDAWAFNALDMGEFMSMEHSRSSLGRLTPALGDAMVTNRRRAILTMVEDTSPGVHDTLLSACDAERYRLLGHEGHHDNCAGNLRAALANLGLEARHVPAPWNLFENVAIGAGGALEIRPPLSRAGDYVVLRAEMEAIVVLSACPMDIVPTNGPDMTPREVAYRVM